MDLQPALLFVCIALAVGLSLCTYLFVSLKREIFRLRKRSDNQQQLLANICKEVERLTGGLKEAERQIGQLPQLSPLQPSMNVNRRTQVLRMHRRGERPDQIAAALGLPQGEVDLVLKVQKAMPAA